MATDILGPEHTLTKRFTKIKRIRGGALSDHVTNTSLVNSAQSHLASSTALPHVFEKYQYQLYIDMQLPEANSTEGKGQSVPQPSVM